MTLFEISKCFRIIRNVIGALAGRYGYGYGYGYATKW